MKKNIVDMLMLTALTAFLILLFASSSTAQSVAVNNTGAAANNSAMLDVNSTTKGMLVPRMTTTQRQNVVSPANGLLVFDMTTNSFWYFSTTWKEIYTSGDVFDLPYAGSYSDAGKIFSITNLSGTTGSSAIYGKNQFASGLTTSHIKGLWGDTYSGVGVLGTSANIGVLGMTGSSTNAIAVKGISTSSALTSGAVTGINDSTGVAVFGESTGGGIGVYGKTTRSNGAAVYGINDASHGHAIQGSATGTDGVAIYGDASSNSNSFAGYFRNSNAINSRNVVQIDNLGTGNFLSLTNGLGDTKTTIAKNGNITTDGTITVKTNMGIIRNSTSAQLRYDVIPATVSGLSLQSQESIEITVNFPTSFSAAPVISVGNTPGNPYYYSFFATAVGNVTTTSCKFSVRNVSTVPISMDHIWKLIAIGPE